MRRRKSARSVALRGNKNSQDGPEPSTKFVYWRARKSDVAAYSKAARRAKADNESDWIRGVLNAEAGFKPKRK